MNRAEYRFQQRLERIGRRHGLSHDAPDERVAMGRALDTVYWFEGFLRSIHRPDDHIGWAKTYHDFAVDPDPARWKLGRR